MSEERPEISLDRRTESGDWFYQIVRFFRWKGHPDDLAVTRQVLSLPTWKEAHRMALLREVLQREEDEGRRLLDELEQIGWTYRRTGIGEGSLEPIGGHPAHGGGRGRRPNYITGIVWTICYAKEIVARRALGEPDPAWVRYRVENTVEMREGIASRYRDLLPAELLTDDAIKAAVNSWLKRKGEPPPWLPSAK